jgi:hypothetical protein
LGSGRTEVESKSDWRPPQARVQIYLIDQLGSLLIKTISMPREKKGQKNAKKAVNLVTMLYRGEWTFPKDKIDA